MRIDAKTVPRYYRVNITKDGVATTNVVAILESQLEGFKAGLEAILTDTDTYEIYPS